MMNEYRFIFPRSSKSRRSLRIEKNLRVSLLTKEEPGVARSQVIDTQISVRVMIKSNLFMEKAQYLSADTI